MKAVVQRVESAVVRVDGKVVGSCNNGFLVLLGAAEGDTREQADILASKIAALRIFSDQNDKMNLSVKDINGDILVVSQFTLCADVRKGNRPSFINALEPAKAEELYIYFCDRLRQLGIDRVETGVFGADMKVELINDGPVTILYDTDIWRKNGN